MKKDIKTITLGCRFNFYESEVAKAIVKSLDPDDNVVIINTCAVTQNAENQSKQAVRRAIRELKSAKILVTGCAVTTCESYFKNLEGVHTVIKNDEKLAISPYTNLPHQNNADFVDFNNFTGDDELFHDRVKVFLQIQTGCNNFCSYCIVPFARGSSKSLPLKVIIDRVKYFHNQGFKELVLSGIDITSYGKDLEPQLELADVIESILTKIPDLQRIRISSINPDGLNDRLLHLITTEHRILPHLHLSIQSGNDKVLHDMRRHYDTDFLKNLIQKIKRLRPEIVIGADVIAGYPTETVEQFDETLLFIENSGISLLHVFPFSPRPKTLASKLIQLPRTEVLSRAAKLRELAVKLKINLFKQFIGKQICGLIEKNEDNFYSGRTDNYLQFKLKSSDKLDINTVTSMHVDSYDQDYLICIK